MTCPPYRIVCRTLQFSCGSYTLTKPSRPPLRTRFSPFSASAQHRLVIAFWWLLSALRQYVVPVSTSSSAVETSYPPSSASPAPADREVDAPSKSHTRMIGPPAETAIVPCSPTSTWSTGLPCLPTHTQPLPSESGTRESHSRTVES